MEPDGLYRIRKTDLARCVQVSAGAFQNDPALKYQLVGGETDMEILAHYFTAVFQTGFPYYRFYATSPAIEGLIGYLPPGNKATPPLEFLFRGGWRLPFSTNREILDRLQKYEEHALDVRRRVEAMDACYLMMLAVDPAQQGRGYGARIMRPFLRMLDELEQDCYLETHKLVNTEIYAHYGFDIAAVDTVPDGTDTQFAMLRKHGTPFR